MIITTVNGLLYTFLSVFQNKQSILDLALVSMSPAYMLSVSSDTDNIQLEDIEKSVEGNC